MLECRLLNKILSILPQHFLPDSIRTAKRLGGYFVCHSHCCFPPTHSTLKWSVPLCCSPDLANVTFTDICPVYYNMCSTDVLAFRAVSGLINHTPWTELHY